MEKYLGCSKGASKSVEVLFAVHRGSHGTDFDIAEMASPLTITNIVVPYSYTLEIL